MKTIYKNKKALYEYELLKSYECGIVLTSQQLKYIRNGKLNIIDSYCHFDSNELYIKNIKIFDADENIKLLLHKYELVNLRKNVQQNGLTIIPISVYDKNGLVKIEIALCKGKKIYDKRESIKEKDIKRDLERYGK